MKNHSASETARAHAKQCNIGYRFEETHPPQVNVFCFSASQRKARQQIISLRPPRLCGEIPVHDLNPLGSLFEPPSLGYENKIPVNLPIG